MDPSRIRNVDWEQLQLVDWLEVGGTLVLVLTDGARRGIAVADPLFGWYVRHFSRLDHPLETWCTASNGGRVFLGRAPEAAERVEMRGPRFFDRCTVRSSGLWAIHAPKHQHVRRIDFITPDEEVIQSIQFTDILPDRSGRVWTFCRAAIARLYLRLGRPLEQVYEPPYDFEPGEVIDLDD